MAKYGDITFKVDWPKYIDFDGRGREEIKSVLAKGDAYLAYAGNAANGWCIYLVDAFERHRKQQISPLFHKDFGDTRRDMMQACARSYGSENSPVVNLGGEHPEECFRWRTD